jgi:superfamily I DNA and/or RNA helicase
MQIAMNEKQAHLRQAQARFMRQWQQVIAYQKEKESIRRIEFEATPRQTEGRISTLSISALQMKENLHDDDKTLYDYYKDVQQSGHLKEENCFKIELWDTGRYCYIPAIPARFRYTARYLWNDNNELEISGHFNSHRDEGSKKFRFSIQLPNAPLNRQDQALEALFHDRMVEPAIKDILLSPESYLPVQDELWISREIVWQNSLSHSQKLAVAIALKAKHLALIQGPPGTGKTTAIVEILYQLFAANPNCKILLVSQQNTAVDNALERFIQRYPELINKSINIIRIGNIDKISDDIQDLHFDASYTEFIQTTRSQAKKNALNDVVGLSDLSSAWLTLLNQIENPLGGRLDNPTVDEFNTVLLADKNLVGATCVGLASRKGGVDNLDFDIAIIDEAGRATVPELLIPLLRCRKAILIGDHFQLPPSISPLLREDDAKEVLPFIKETFLETSFFERLFNSLPDACKAILQEQYRMAPDIGNLVADLFYTDENGRKLHNGYGDDFDLSRQSLTHSLYWVDVKGHQSKKSNTTSIANTQEAESIVNFLGDLAKKITLDQDVAVITPYGAQKKLIREKLKIISDSADNADFKIGNLSIKVDTVDSFQGSEADIVCYSTVRTVGSLQFLLDRKRLNVACSRARNHLVFFGHMEFLRTYNPGKGEINLFRKIILRAQRDAIC